MDSDKKTLSVPTLGLLLEPPAAAPARLDRPSYTGGIFRWLARLNWLFIFTVLLPTVGTTVYYVAFASDIFVSESSFVVQSSQDQAQSESSIGALLKSSVASSGDADTANVQEFMQSRDALRTLEKDDGLRKAFDNNGIDSIGRFGGPIWWDRSFESLYRYYKNRVVSLESAQSSSSISELQVRAFTADDACRINKKLLEMGEKLVNTLNERLQADLVRYAESEVASAEKKAEASHLALADFRNTNSIVDPTLQSKSELDLINKLQEQLIETRNQIIQLNTNAASNPMLPSLRNRESSLVAAIAAEMAKAAGDKTSFSNKSSEYERLTFERDFAQKQVAEALTFLERSRNDAQRKQLYLERIVEPNLPDVAVEPKRLRNIGGILAVGLVVWGTIALFVAGVREHQQ